MVGQPPGVVLEPGGELRVPGEGLPLLRNPYIRGDLIIKFKVRKRRRRRKLIMNKQVIQ